MLANEHLTPIRFVLLQDLVDWETDPAELRRHQAGAQAFMLGRLRVRALSSGFPSDELRLTLVTDRFCIDEIERFHAAHSRRVRVDTVEVPDAQLDEWAREWGYHLFGEAAPERIAAFHWGPRVGARLGPQSIWTGLRACHAAGLPFTAQASTGFELVRIPLAAALMGLGYTAAEAGQLLAESDPTSLTWRDSSVEWRGRRIALEDVRAARTRLCQRVVGPFPRLVEDLKALNWL